jgi:hypothetical protein
MLLGASVALILSIGGSTAGATNGTVSLSVTGFAHHDTSSTHDGVCAAPYAGSDAQENLGTMYGNGAYFGSVNLPQGARITAFRLTAGDNDTDIDVYAYLNRKRLAPAANPGTPFGAYKTLASVKSSGATGTLRRFSTTSVTNRVVDNAKFAYFVEVVACGDAVDLIGIQVSWTKA